MIRRRRLSSSLYPMRNAPATLHKGETGALQHYFEKMVGSKAECDFCRLSRPTHNSFIPSAVSETLRPTSEAQ